MLSFYGAQLAADYITGTVPGVEKDAKKAFELSKRVRAFISRSTHCDRCKAVCCELWG